MRNAVSGMLTEVGPATTIVNFDRSHDVATELAFKKEINLHL